MQLGLNPTSPSPPLEEAPRNESVVIDREEQSGDEMYDNLTSPINSGRVQSSSYKDSFNLDGTITDRQEERGDESAEVTER